MKISVQNIVTRIRTAMAYRFSLHSDQSSFDDIDQNIRDGIVIRGTNLWVLMLAIFIASIGLNVNSTAVIIGAMLISPLMGPIMGIGYGAGINDYPLIKKALGNLLISISIALFTSTLYFFISPLSTAQSELLARTTPSIWDVLIALFGGLAGIIASTRREKSNIIPGVAIATALMPPLCTAGYGIAHGSMEMFLGAFYLFFINGVFIAFATLLVVTYIDPPHKRFVSAEVEIKMKRYIYAVVLATVLPSIYLAYGLVTREVFNSRANEFIKNELVFENGFIAKQTVSADERLIDITLVGQKISDEQMAEFSNKLQKYRITDARLIVHQTVIKELDEASLKKSLLADVLNSNQQTFDTKNKQLQDLQNELSRVQLQQSNNDNYLKDNKKIFDELIAQYPQIERFSIAKTTEYKIGAAISPTVLLLHLTTSKSISKDDRHKIISWLKVRTGVEQVNLSIDIKK
ncbi:MAG: TIGR00341 family protein [Gallionella sp.]|jgi:uncharacterized hydrophobic protein (TIGR00271 family)